jgi:hypothetical protein
MIRIAISQAAFDAIAATLPLHSISFENKTDEQERRLIWLPPDVVDKLRSLRGAGESYSECHSSAGRGAGRRREHSSLLTRRLAYALLDLPECRFISVTQCRENQAIFYGIDKLCRFRASRPNPGILWPRRRDCVHLHCHGSLASCH